MKIQRRIQYSMSLPRSKADWLDARAEAMNRRPSELFEAMVDEAMEADQGAKKNGADKHPQAAKRA